LVLEKRSLIECLLVVSSSCNFISHLASFVPKARI
jgi:hypothetical protein